MLSHISPEQYIGAGLNFLTNSPITRRACVPEIVYAEHTVPSRQIGLSSPKIIVREPSNILSSPIID